MFDANCRLCKEQTIQKGFLFKCIKKGCKAVLWDKTAVKKALKENRGEKEKIIADAEIPKVPKGTHFVYILRMRQSKKEKEKRKKDGTPLIQKEYIGETAFHPYKRYLNHIIGHKHSRRHRTDRYATALIYFKGEKMTRKVAVEEERTLINKRRAKGINALGGHIVKEG